MEGGQASGLKRFIFWDYPRASWQYDVMVALILGFIFLTPREWFRDQPKASSIVMLPAQHGSGVYWIEPELLRDTPEAERISRAEQLLQNRYGRKLKVNHLETIFDAEKDIKGFMAYTRPQELR
jgi:hypothetical protein